MNTIPDVVKNNIVNVFNNFTFIDEFPDEPNRAKMNSEVYKKLKKIDSLLSKIETLTSGY